MVRYLPDRDYSEFAAQVPAVISRENISPVVFGLRGNFCTLKEAVRVVQGRKNYSCGVYCVGSAGEFRVSW